MPTQKRALAPLQPLASNDPLAVLFNDWLSGLQPIEQFTRPRPHGQPDAESEQMRARLLTATGALHHLHDALNKATALLSQGFPLTKLAPLFRSGSNHRPGIGSCPAELNELLDYVALQGAITSRADCKRIMRYSAAHRFKLAEAASEQPHLERTCGLLLAVFDAADDAREDYYFLRSDNPAGRTALLALLHDILALDCFEKV